MMLIAQLVAIVSLVCAGIFFASPAAVSEAPELLMLLMLFVLLMLLVIILGRLCFLLGLLLPQLLLFVLAAAGAAEAAASIADAQRFVATRRWRRRPFCALVSFLRRFASATSDSPSCSRLACFLKPPLRSVYCLNFWRDCREGDAGFVPHNLTGHDVEPGTHLVVETPCSPRRYYPAALRQRL